MSAFLAGFQGSLLTTWPVLTEVCHWLPTYIVPRFLRWAALSVELHDAPTVALADIAAWMEKYHDLPMDLADASLDQRGFGVYRLSHGRRFHNVLMADELVC